MEIDRIYNEDCLEGMKRIPDGVVDAIITDPPYGTTDSSWDRQVDLSRMWAEFKRVAKPNAAILIFSQLPFAVDVINANRKMFRYEWIWQKAHAVGFLNVHRMPLRAHENVLVFYRKLPTYNPQMSKGEPYFKKKSGVLPADSCYSHWFPCEHINESGLRFPHDVLKFKHDPERYDSTRSQGHSARKPTALLEYLIRTYTNEGELVLDAFMGSGTTAVAALRTSRHFVGFELSTDLHALCLKRISEAVDEDFKERDRQRWMSGD